MLNKNTVGLVAQWRWGHAGGYGGGNVIECVVLRVNSGDAHLELIGISRVVQCFFLRDESRLK